MPRFCAVTAMSSREPMVIQHVANKQSQEKTPTRNHVTQGDCLFGVGVSNKLSYLGWKKCP